MFYFALVPFQGEFGSKLYLHLQTKELWEQNEDYVPENVDAAHADVLTPFFENVCAEYDILVEKINDFTYDCTCAITGDQQVKINWKANQNTVKADLLASLGIDPDPEQLTINQFLQKKHRKFVSPDLLQMSHILQADSMFDYNEDMRNSLYDFYSDGITL